MFRQAFSLVGPAAASLTAGAMICFRIEAQPTACSSTEVSVRNLMLDPTGIKSRFAVVLGAQWGDEGKGKLVDILAQRAI